MSIGDNQHHTHNSDIQALRPIWFAFDLKHYYGGYRPLLMTTKQL